MLDGNSLTSDLSNGVRQGSVLSPILFCIYLDGLLEALSDTNVGCHWGIFILLVHSVMQMTLFNWLPLLWPSDIIFSWVAVQCQ